MMSVVIVLRKATEAVRVRSCVQRWQSSLLIDDMPARVARISYTRSSGPGGQNVNKVNTKAELRLDLRLAVENGWLKADAAKRLRESQASRINASDEFIITAQEYRSQQQNRQACYQKLSQVLENIRYPPKERKLRSGISEKTKEVRRDHKRKRSVVKQNRRKSFDW